MILCHRECLKVGLVFGLVRDGFGDVKLYSWIGSTRAKLESAVVAGCGVGVLPDLSIASAWIAEELGKVKVTQVPDCETVDGVRRAVTLLELPECL